jgi:uncharacterized protein YegP (UPF0339 family)
MAGKFVLKKNAGGQFHFNLVASNGQVIATSETYESKAAALNGIESVKENAPGAPTEDQTLEARGGVEMIQITRAAALAVACGALGATASTANAAIPAQWRNCDAVHLRYPHGVGRAGAHDVTKSGDPVTNFKRSTSLYNLAMKYNKRLDADKDGIACEQH